MRPITDNEYACWAYEPGDESRQGDAMKRSAVITRESRERMNQSRSGIGTPFVTERVWVVTMTNHANGVTVREESKTKADALRWCESMDVDVVSVSP